MSARGMVQRVLAVVAVVPRRVMGCLILACSAFGVIAAGSAAASQSLSDIFRSPRFAHLGLAPLGPALASTVASTYPVASASSSVTFVYNRDLDTVERRSGPLGPILGERAETIGKGQFDLALTYSFVDLTTINGEPLTTSSTRRSSTGASCSSRSRAGRR